MLRLPVQGTPLHTRSLTVALSPLAADRWLVRGDVIDLRKTGFVPSTYDLQPSGVIHSMNIELELDPRRLVLETIRVDQPFVAIEASPETGGECCRDPAPRLLDLRGETLDPGFTKRLGEAFGGPRGCSHLLTLFQLMASVVPRAAALECARAEREGTAPRMGERFFRRAVFLDGHDHDADHIDVALQLTDTHARPVGPDDPVTRRLAGSHEVKIGSRVDRKRFRLDSLLARERARDADTLGGTPWQSHDSRLASLVGAPLIPGMAGRIFGLVGDDPALLPLRDTLLQMAPGFIQIMAATMDAHFEARASRTAADAGEPPAVASIGGNQDSCYMWRRDGAILRSWARRAGSDPAAAGGDA